MLKMWSIKPLHTRFRNGAFRISKNFHNLVIFTIKPKWEPNFRNFILLSLYSLHSSIALILNENFYLLVIFLFSEFAFITKL